VDIVRCVGFLVLITLLGHGQAPQEHRQVDLSSQAKIPVRRLYQQLASRPVGGIPTPKRMKQLSPYLSSALLQRIEQTRACADDWFRQNRGRFEKPGFMWGEIGLFSGTDALSVPRTFLIEKMESENNGSFHAFVKLTAGNPPQKPWSWRVAVVVLNENKHFVISDVIFLKDDDRFTETRLSEILTRGCDGSRWVGYGNPFKVQKRF